MEHKIVELEERLKSRDQYDINGIKSLCFWAKYFFTLSSENYSPFPHLFITYGFSFGGATLCLVLSVLEPAATDLSTLCCPDVHLDLNMFIYPFIQKRHVESCMRYSFLSQPDIWIGKKLDFEMRDQ